VPATLAPSASPARTERRSPRPPYWLVCPTLVWDGEQHVERLVPECRNGHPLLSRDVTGGAGVFEYRGDRHLAYTCTVPHCGSRQFGIQHEKPSPLLHLYAISAEQLGAYLRLPRDTPSHEVLELLGYIARGDA
jgi:hypothetical protein